MKKSKNHWYARYVGDYMRKTQHLSMTEHGAYGLLIDHYFATEQPLAANASVLHRVCKAFACFEQEAVQTVLEQFFYRDGDKWRHERIDYEILKRQNISKVRSEAAHAKHEKAKAANASVLHTRLQTTPTPTPKIINTPLPPPVDQQGVGVFKDGSRGNGYSIIDRLTDEGLQRAKAAAPGWDIYYLANAYNNGIDRRGEPKMPDKAFPAWCANYTKGLRPRV